MFMTFPPLRLAGFAALLLIALPGASGQPNPADIIECDSLVPASQASQFLGILGIPVPSDPNELVGSRCTQTSVPCAATPPETQCEADFCACCTTVIFTGGLLTPSYGTESLIC
ncbi:hypothetical protein EVG20_g2760 [Dentipellis fragilis]|uniref:Hydrophobin n=1 Tax=Dentipellis fragilis TaxID=205917 RepID=A0A4Y9Z8T9_9AGAM|nr:hypothetical protein EVG20_g2760 [Dentipellis fragilis]